MATILIIGANGGIGRQAVEQALQEGHFVTAIVRDPSKLGIAHTALKVVKADIMQPETFEKELAGKDVVLSAIGVKGGLMGDKPTTLYSQGNANLLRAMEKMHVKRAFFVSASALDISPELPFFARFAARYIVQKLLRHMYADLRTMEEIIKGSGADYTIIRPPRLTDRPATGRYRVAIDRYLKNCLRISRADVAHFMLHNFSNEDTYRATTEIGY